MIEMETPLNKDIIDKTTEMSIEVLDEACLSIFKRDYDSVDTAIEKSRIVASRLTNINEIYRIKIITENIRRIAEYANDIAGVVLNMTVQQKLRKD